MLELTIRLVFSLAVVVGLLLVLARVGARRFSGRTGALVQVVHRQPLTRTSSVAVVTVGTRVLVLGATEQQVNVLTELDPEELVEDDAEVFELPGLLEAVGADEPAPVPAPAVVRRSVAGSHRASHRADRGANQRADRAAPRQDSPETVPGGALAGSVLSPQTWRQALAALAGPGRRAS